MLRSTGIKRRFDDLGRIVIPHEVRKQLGIAELLFMGASQVMWSGGWSVQEGIHDMEDGLFLGL